MQEAKSAEPKEPRTRLEGSKTRIVFLIRSLDRGGAERQLIELVRGLDKSRFEITVATFYSGGDLWHEMAAIGGIRLLTLRKRGRWDLLPFFIRYCRAVREARPHLVHAYMGFANELALVANGISRARIVWGLRGSGCDYSHYQDWARGFGHRMGAWLSRFADRIIVNSEAGRQEHIADGYCGDRMIVVHNGIDTARFRPDPEAGLRVRREWGIGPEEPLIGIVARLDPMKDHPLFLRAAAMLARRRPEARFVCVGNGPQRYREHLQALASGMGLNGRLIWRPARNDVGAVYNALTLLTSSSAFGEGFSNVIGEAMACGKPAVVTEVGDSAVVVESRAWVVPPGEPEALVAAWEKILALSPEALAVCGRAARERVVREFSLERLVSNTERTLLEIAP